jgi:hypothetical protein
MLGSRETKVNSQVVTPLHESLNTLDKMEQEHLRLGQAMFSADGGKLFGMDLLASGVLKRSLAHIHGFRSLLTGKNMLCAGVILRLQLDTAMRFHAAWLVTSPHNFALQVLGGAKVRDLLATDGKKMTDTYLVQKLGEQYEWVPRVYERTSGYVHLSATHIMSALSVTDEASRTITVSVSALDGPLPQWIYEEAAEAFCATTDIILRYIHGWAYTKANPEAARAKPIEDA